MAQKKTIHLRIVTPSKSPVEMDADMFLVQTNGAQIAILPYHMSMLANVDISVLTVVIDGQESHYAVGGGALRVDSETDSATLLVPSIVAAKDITIEQAREQEALARQKLERAASNEEHREAQRELLRALNVVDVSQNFKI